MLVIIIHFFKTLPVSLTCENLLGSGQSLIIFSPIALCEKENYHWLEEERDSSNCQCLAINELSDERENIKLVG